jgi:hypothetical protein
VTLGVGVARFEPTASSSRVVGMVLLVVKLPSSMHMRMPAQDGRSAHRLLYGTTQIDIGPSAWE